MDLNLQGAAKYLINADQELAKIIKTSGIAKIVPHTDYYWALVDSIISQQLSVQSAAAIEKRFRDYFKKDVPLPEDILSKSIIDLRSTGLSSAKATYIRDLAQHITNGKIAFETFKNLSNEQIVAILTDVKGIGEWTAHMFLIFCMGRLDVLATGDYGIRKGVQLIYNLPELPTPIEVQSLAISHNWHPYESAACWYVWQALDNKPLR